MAESYKLGNIKGPTGSTGAAGKSAYAQAMEGGYTGTESEFNNAIANLSPMTLVTPYTHTKAGTVHQLKGAAGASTIQFKATAAFADNDTFTVNGTAMTAITLDGATLHTGDFAAGADVLAVVNSGKLTLQIRSYYSQMQDKANASQLNNTDFLINSFFGKGVINQLGKTQYVTIPQGGYTIDGWLLNANGKMTLTNEGISVSFAEETENPTFFQSIENTESLRKKTLAFSVLCSGVVDQVTFTVPPDDNDSILKVANTSFGSIRGQMLNKNLIVVVFVNPGTTANFQAAKLERGILSTIKNTPQNLQQALAKCRRYYCICQLPQVPTSWGDAYKNTVFFDQPMRVTPVVTMTAGGSTGGSLSIISVSKYGFHYTVSDTSPEPSGVYLREYTADARL